MKVELAHGVPLAPYTSWRVGGAARSLYRPPDVASLQAFLQRLDPAEPLLWLGLGSNLLVSDAGFSGTVIHTRGRLNALERAGPRNVRAQCGVSCAKLARFAADAGLTGLEFLAGIPGTLGGALAMNAGAHGHAIWDFVQRVQVLDRRGNLKTCGPECFRIGYRQVEGLEEAWFLGAEFRLSPGAPDQSRARIRTYLARRRRTQPLHLPSCGSVFRNPSGDYAARLIEAAGLKGMRIGDAVVSEKHANFILNQGRAKASEIRQLIERVRARVAAHSGIWLSLEVKPVGWED